MREFKKGYFITFEGPEGSGKSTHSRLLADFLRKKGVPVLRTREPGGVKISEKIREVLLDPKNKDMDPVCETLLYMAARSQIMRDKIKPALKAGKIVICDRFLDATIAYQGYGEKVDIETIRDMGRIVTGGYLPRLTFLLDIEAEEGLKRSVGKKDRMEKKSLAFHRRVRRGYLSIAGREPGRVKVVPADAEINKTQQKIRDTISRCLKI